MLAEELFQMKIETNSALFDGKMIRFFDGMILGLVSPSFRGDDVFCARQ